MENFITQYASIALFIVMVIEFVLGKTKLVKANSTIEAVLNGLKGVINFFFKEKSLELPKKK